MPIYPILAQISCEKFYNLYRFIPLRRRIDLFRACWKQVHGPFFRSFCFCLDKRFDLYSCRISHWLLFGREIFRKKIPSISSVYNSNAGDHYLYHATVCEKNRGMVSGFSINHRLFFNGFCDIVSLVYIIWNDFSHNCRRDQKKSERR